MIVRKKFFFETLIVKITSLRPLFFFMFITHESLLIHKNGEEQTTVEVKC